MLKKGRGLKSDEAIVAIRRQTNRNRFRLVQVRYLGLHDLHDCHDRVRPHLSQAARLSRLRFSLVSVSSRSVLLLRLRSL
jgi:hypothetical protein